jgi:hypothetical protein
VMVMVMVMLIVAVASAWLGDICQLIAAHRYMDYSSNCRANQEPNYKSSY